jgi:hypothetical protein
MKWDRSYKDDMTIEDYEINDGFNFVITNPNFPSIAIQPLIESLNNDREQELHYKSLYSALHEKD